MAKAPISDVDEYQVIAPSGAVVLGAPASCRYPKPIEKSIMEAGYTILLYGKPIPKPNLKKGRRL